MKKLYFVLFQFIGLGLFAQALTTNPSPIVVDQPVTITVFVNSTDTDCNHFNNPTKVYMHAGIGNDAQPWSFAVVGNWGQDDGVGLMTDNGNGSWSITITPSTYFNLTTAQINQATKMGMVFRNEDGSQEFKDNGCQDFILNVVQNSSAIDENKLTDLQVYPNPVKTDFSFSKKISNLKIFSIDGKLIKSYNGNFDKYYRFSMNNLEQGWYIIGFGYNDKVYTKKILKE